MVCEQADTEFRYFTAFQSRSSWMRPPVVWQININVWEQPVALIFYCAEDTTFSSKTYLPVYHYKRCEIQEDRDLNTHSHEKSESSAVVLHLLEMFTEVIFGFNELKKLRTKFLICISLLLLYKQNVKSLQNEIQELHLTQNNL